MFTRAAAKGEWKDLKVGRKLTFILFEGHVSNLKLHETSWDEDIEDVVIPENTKVIGYETSIRTVVCSISEITEDLMIVDTGENQHLYIPLADHQNLNWYFMVGDVVS